MTETIKCKALRFFTDTLMEYGQIHGDPDGVPAAKNPKVPIERISVLAAAGKIEAPPGWDDEAQAIVDGEGAPEKKDPPKKAAAKKPATKKKDPPKKAAAKKPATKRRKPGPKPGAKKAAAAKKPAETPPAADKDAAKDGEGAGETQSQTQTGEDGENGGGEGEAGKPLDPAAAAAPVT